MGSVGVPSFILYGRVSTFSLLSTTLLLPRDSLDFIFLAVPLIKSFLNTIHTIYPFLYSKSVLYM